MAAVVTLARSAHGPGIARRAVSPFSTIAVARFDNQTGLADYDRYAQDVTDALVAELTDRARDALPSSATPRRSALRASSAISWRSATR